MLMLFVALSPETECAPNQSVSELNQLLGQPLNNQPPTETEEEKKDRLLRQGLNVLVGKLKKKPKKTTTVKTTTTTTKKTTTTPTPPPSGKTHT